MPRTDSVRKWFWRTVLGAMIFAGVSFVMNRLLGGGLFRDVGGWAWVSLTFAWDFLLSDISVPMWLFMAVSAGAAMAILATVAIVANIISERRQPWRAYTEALIDDMMCRWEWSRSNQIERLFFFCPTCKGELVHSSCTPYFRSGSSFFVCEKCSRERGRQRVFAEEEFGSGFETMERIKREIRRRCNTGEWKSGT